MMKRILVTLTLLMVALAAHAQIWTNTPPQFWTSFSGDWGLFDGRMVTQTFGQEHWIWAGNPPLVTQGDLDAELKLEFANVPNDDVGRHGGIMFLASVAAHRFATAMNGYTIDWIDRLDDHGFRLFRWDNGLFFPLAAGATNLADPPKLWQLEVRGDVIRFRADGQLVLEVLDATYRQGHFGIWAHGWAGVPSLNVQKLLVDDVKVGPTFHDNFDPPPTLDMQRLGNNVVLNWTNAAFALQSAPNVSGTFTNVPGATSPYTNPISGGKQFFRLSLSGGCSSGISGLLAHEPFDYAAGSALDTMNGGTGFSGPWSSTIAGPNYLIADGSLNFSPLCLSGGRLTSATGHTQMARALASDFGADGSTRYFSFLLRPEGVLNGGDFGGFHGLVLQGGPRLFIGKTGGGALEFYVLEEQGGAGQVSSAFTVVVGETVFLVVKAEFAAGNDTFTLYVNPAPGSPEPATGTVKSDLDLGTSNSLLIYSGGEFSLDELRFGETFESVTPR